ncbi:hypothetical protein ORI20_26505 [Mycobacterium sp. CVI_P3]|uniref:Bacteriophage protein n=1 Tax=Mycobacterium pinniadriaticum TaxID=2994102 RepID=A0ABT3SL49_9MYCO|nr:hypothetical protein [Mycobacterium pinniadriaticum]MCX2933828.1 hypothetical protein [Mycobacterium pinniadriaticum]MCX2940250.1 hypothetical protein [Mycobacterium pinniadriaticum]
MMPPYYESRFIRANHPDRAQAIWLRWTLLLPEPGDAAADVWVMVFDPEGAGNRAIKVAHPATVADYLSDPWSARIADTVIDDVGARGVLDGARWDLVIAPGDEPMVKLLTDRAYAAKFPTAKTQVRHPLARFDGTVALGDTSIAVQAWRGSVNHNWGTKHTPAYAFGQVCGFDGQPESSLEVVTARAAVGPLRLPAATLFVLRHAGWEVAVRSVLAARHTRGSYEPFRWSFGGRTDGFEVRGEIRAEPRDVIGLTYTDTNGDTKYCYNSALADCRITLSGNGVDAELTASRRAMFEILTDERHGTVPVLV